MDRPKLTRTDISNLSSEQLLTLLEDTSTLSASEVSDLTREQFRRIQEATLGGGDVRAAADSMLEDFGAKVGEGSDKTNWDAGRERYNTQQARVEKVRASLNNPLDPLHQNPVQRKRAELFVQSADADKNEPEIRKLVNEIANRHENKSNLDQQMMRGLVSPEEHKQIMKRTQKRKEMFDMAKSYKEESLQEGRTQYNQFLQLLRQDEMMSPMEKRKQEEGFRKQILKETGDKIRQGNELEIKLYNPGEPIS